jgi:hypothetical protein
MAGNVTGGFRRRLENRHARGAGFPQIHPDFRLRSGAPGLRRDKSSGFICGL